MKHLSLVLVGLFLTLSTQAQEFGFIGGIHSGKATSESATGSTDAENEISYRAGLAMRSYISPRVSLRSGVMYNARTLHFEGTNFTTDYNLRYLDVPVLFQFQFTEIFAGYVGAIAAFNVGKKFENQNSGVRSTGDLPGTKSIVPFGQAGLNFNFDDFGIDVYYERSVANLTSDSGTDTKDFNAFGANFIYWF